MILYGSSYFGLPQLTIFNGSAVYRTMLPSSVSVFFYFTFFYLIGEGETADEVKVDDHALFTVHPFVITIYVMAYSLIITHRLNYCYQRYWESCSSIFTMTSKWIDSATALASFHYQSEVFEENRPISFGDQDKDKTKRAPKGGNQRTAGSVGYLSEDILYSFTEYDDEASIDESSAATNSSRPQPVPPLAPPHSLSGSTSSGATTAVSSIGTRGTRGTRGGSLVSQKSFVAVHTRQRYRSSKALVENNQDEESESDSESIQSKRARSIFQRIFQWEGKGKGKSKSKRLSSATAAEASLSPSDAADNNSNKAPAKALVSSLKQSGAIPTGSDRSSSSAPNEMFTSAPMVPSFPKQGQPKKMRSDPIRSKYARKSVSAEKLSSNSSAHSRHRRLPSTDIPVHGVGGSVVKSFKPNPSLAWQKRNTIAMPSNTGLHPTATARSTTDPDYDIETMLLEEEKERKQETRRRQIEEMRRKFEQTGRRPSLQLLKRPSLIFQQFSDHNSDSNSSNSKIFTSTKSLEILKGNNEPTTTTSQPGSSAQTDSNRDKPKNITGFSNLNKKLELFDLPSLHKDSARDTSERTETSNPELNSEFPSTKPDQYASSPNIAIDPQSSKLFQPPVEKLNRKTSLFLQEAAHLYSLISAVSMASLRNDMEGVSSPLVDYVPGQKFPPVNPEEMQIKILVEDGRPEYDTEIEPEFDQDIIGNNTKTCSSIRVKRNNNNLNVLMFLFGFSRNSRQRTIYNASRPFQVLGGISDAEVEMLRKVRGHAAQHALCCLWLKEFITREHLNGSTGKVHPPIVARVYQYISDGSTQYNNCRKTANTDFPFPHAQLISFFGFVSIFMFPLLFYTYVNDTLLGVILNVFTVSCFFGILEVALELEQPFIRYPNDLPLNNYQAQFNEALISSLYSGFHPDSWGEVVDNEGIFGTNNDSGGENRDTSVRNSSGSIINSKSTVHYSSGSLKTSSGGIIRTKKTRKKHKPSVVSFAISSGERDQGSSRSSSLSFAIPDGQSERSTGSAVSFAIPDGQTERSDEGSLLSFALPGDSERSRGSMVRFSSPDGESKRSTGSTVRFAVPGGESERSTGSAVRFAIPDGQTERSDEGSLLSFALPGDSERSRGSMVRFSSPDGESKRSTGSTVRFAVPGGESERSTGSAVRFAIPDGQTERSDEG